ncbi:MAG: PAS domain S-box protein [Dehalococcoidia bacterium]
MNSTDDEALERLRESEEMYARVFHQNPNPMTLTSLVSQRFVAANEAFLRLVGYTRSEVLGRTSEELNLWGERTTREKITRELFNEGESGPHRGDCRNKAGELIPCRVHFRIIETAIERYVLSSFIPD